MDFAAELMARFDALDFHELSQFSRVESALRFDAVDGVLESAAGGAMAIDQLRLLACLLACFPFGALMLAVPRALTVVRHVLSIVVGSFFLAYNCRVGSLHVLIASALGYVMLVSLPRRWSAKLVFVVLMAYLAAGFIYRVWHDKIDLAFEWTSPMMVVVVKVTNLAFSYYDGSFADAELDPELRPKRVVALPDPLSFFGFIAFPPTVLAGPYCLYTEYAAFIDRSMFEEFNFSEPAGATLAAVRKLLVSFFWAALSLGGGAYFPVTRSFIMSSAFTDMPLWRKVVHMYVAMPCERAKYSFVWGIGDASSTFMGMGYNGRDKSGALRFDRMTNVRQERIEVSQSLKEVTDNWNLGGSSWLRHSVYVRVGGSKNPYATQLTFLLSSMWHGFYSGYYFFFLSMGLFLAVARQLRAIFQPREGSTFLTLRNDKGEIKSPLAKSIYDRLGNLLTITVLNYGACGFVLLRADYTVACWRQFYFAPHVVGLLLWLVLPYVPRPRVQRKTAAGAGDAKKTK